MTLEEARKLAVEYELAGPDWALDITIPISRIRECIGSEGGCGPGKLGDKIIPDKVLFLNIKPACYIHDCRYSDLSKPESKYLADIELFINADKIVRLNSNWLTRLIRRRILLVYLNAVDYGGSKFAK